jgi:hypothetical protein
MTVANGTARANAIQIAAPTPSPKSFTFEQAPMATAGSSSLALPHELERLRRSIAMLRPGMKREEAIRILEELQRLQRDRRHAELVGRLRALLDDDR